MGIFNRLFGTKPTATPPAPPPVQPEPKLPAWNRGPAYVVQRDGTRRPVKEWEMRIGLTINNGEKLDVSEFMGEIDRVYFQGAEAIIKGDSPSYSTILYRRISRSTVTSWISAFRVCAPDPRTLKGGPT